MTAATKVDILVAADPVYTGSRSFLWEWWLPTPPNQSRWIEEVLPEEPEPPPEPPPVGIDVLVAADPNYSAVRPIPEAIFAPSVAEGFPEAALLAAIAEYFFLPGFTMPPVALR